MALDNSRPNDNVWISRLLVGNGWLVAFVAFVIFAAVYAPQVWFIFFFVELQRDLNATAVETGWLGSIMWSTTMLLSPISAILEMHLGIKTVASLGIIISSLSYLMSSFAKVAPLLYLTFGLANGFGNCLVLHSTLRMFYNLYSGSTCQRIIALTMIGPYAGAAIGNGLVQSLLVTQGWRVTMRYIAAMIVTMLPLTLIFYDRETKKPVQDSTLDKKTNLESNETKIPENGHNNPSFVMEEENHGPGDECEKPERNKKTLYEIPRPIFSQPRVSEKLKTFVKLLDTWCISVAYFFMFFALSIYQMNFVSFFESLHTLTLNDIWLLTTTANISDVLSRIFLCVIGGNIGCRPIYVMLGSALLMAVVSTIFSFVTTVGPLLVLSCVMGFCRSMTVVLSWHTAVNLLGSQYADYVVTLVMYCQGCGYTTGSLPAGAIYDATGSYSLAFILAAVAYTVSGSILILLAVRSSSKVKKRKVSCQKETKQRQPRVSLVSYNIDIT